MVKHKTAVNIPEEKSHIYKDKRAIKGHRYNFDQGEIIAAESIERPERSVEATYSNHKKETINKTFDLPVCYYGVLEKHMPQR